MHNHGLGAWMTTRRQKTPDKTALIFQGGQTMTYRALADDTDRISAVLWHRGIRIGDPVAFLGENSPEFLSVMFACAQLGAVFVPVNTRLAPPGHHVGASRVIGGWPPRAEWRRPVL